MNPIIIAKYRKVDWFFAVYRSIDLQVIYRMKPVMMEPFYQKWERQWREKGNRDINNPKIPLRHVMERGEIVWLVSGKERFELEKNPRKPRTPRKQITIDDMQKP